MTASSQRLALGMPPLRCDALSCFGLQVGARNGLTANVSPCGCGPRGSAIVHNRPPSMSGAAMLLVV
eukprot:363801-Chlamydomonas_euryale.AAC.15